MRKASLSVFGASLFLSSVCAYGQTVSRCDLNQDGAVTTADVQLAVNMTLGLAPCTANIAGAKVCNAVVVQRVINATANGVCLVSTGLHVVALSWTASNSSNVAGYKVYRGTTSGGPYTLLSSVGNVINYMDTTVVSGQAYFYVATAVDSSGNESAYSAESKAAIPNP